MEGITFTLSIKISPPVRCMLPETSSAGGEYPTKLPGSLPIPTLEIKSDLLENKILKL